MTVTSQNAHVKPATFQINAVESITWNDRTYTRHMVGGSFLAFVIWLVKGEEFTMVIADREFEVSFWYDGYVYHATTSNYDGPGDHINNYHSPHSRAHALAGLAEQLQEAILSDRI